MGGAASVSTEIARQVPDAYFNYSPNFIDCGRVLGLQFGNANGIGSIGVPIPRDRSCDIWKAVNEAQENGHIALSYAFMCEIRNVRRVWGLERCQQLTQAAWDAHAPEPTFLFAAADPDELERRVERQAAVIDAQATELETLRSKLGEAERRAQRASQAAQRAEQAANDYEQRKQALRDYFESKESSDDQ